MSAQPDVPPFVLAPHAIGPAETTAVLETAVVAPADVSVFDVSGPGAVTCLQGLLTNDIENAGTSGTQFAAVLTPKGMIVSDLWASRSNDRVWLTVPNQGRDALGDVFAKFLPPRLAKTTLRPEQSVLRLSGPTSLAVARKAGIAIPDPGTSTDVIMSGISCFVSRPPDMAYFSLQLQIDEASRDRVVKDLERAGALSTGEDTVELARILWGWPRLGAEIDAKTLPQEVRFDELHGVSYTKGCYTGQETVARIHFRGHPNRRLYGLIWDDAPAPEDPAIHQDGTTVGRVSSIAWFPPLEQNLGLGIVHRKTDLDRLVVAGRSPAEIVALPFQFDA